MIFANFAKYIDDQDKIAQVRPKHRDYLSGLLAEGKVAGAGPFTDGTGTLILYNVDTLGDVQALVKADPFTTYGVYAGCDIKPWKIVFSKTELLSPA